MKQSRRLVAIVALLAISVAAVGIIRIFIGDPLGAIGLVGSFTLLAASTYWLVFGRRLERVLATVIALGAVAMLVYIIVRAPVSNVTGAVTVLLLLGMASLAGKEALAPKARAASAPRPSGVTPRFKKMFLLINPKSGGGKAVKFDIPRKAREMGVDVRVLEKGDDLQALAREAAESGTEVLAMGGGDGSLGLVAAVAVEYDIPFVCIPVGTRNHFAMDMNLNRKDPAAALAAFDGEERVIDVATIGDRVFLNNASFGVYAAAVNEPGYREAKGSAFQRVITEILDGRRAPFDLRLRTPKGSLDSAFLVFVGNNEYEFIGLQDVGGRRRLDAGQLHITVVEPSGREAMRKLANGLIMGNPDFAEGFHQWTTDELGIDSADDTVSAGTDGEALEFATPVKLSIMRRALRVLVPQGTPLERPPNPRVFTPESIQKLGEIASGKDV